MVGAQATPQTAELRAAQEKGIIRVLDLCVVQKDEQGNVVERELSEPGGGEASALSPLAANAMGLLADEDIRQVAADMPNKSAAGLLLFEHTWAIGLKEAIRNAGAVAVTGGFVSPDVVAELEAELEVEQHNA